MEAATPLRPARVSIFGDIVVADGLAVRDRCAVELVRDRSDAGADPAGVLVDAIEIGARVLSREQAEVNADFVRTEFEKVSREVEGAFSEKARTVAEFLGKRVDDVFAPENGQLAKELERLFGAESAVAVQHQLRAVMAEQSARMREDLLKQFSSADAHNPLADFKAGTMAAMKRAAEQQDRNLNAMSEQIAGLKHEVVKLQAEREKQLEVAAEHARSTAKGRPYEEAVVDAIDAIAHARGDDCDAVGDVPGSGGRKGDVLVGVDGATGSPRARIVFEAKNSYVPKNKAVAELEAAMAQRDADYGVWVVPSEDLLPGRGPQLREVNGDKLFVVFDPEERARLGLEVAYALARARTIMARAGGDGLDAGALRSEVERALAAMEDVRRIKSQLTAAAGAIDSARKILEDMAERVRGHLAQVDALVVAGTGDDSPPQGTLV
ncbi:MAG TPA: hypothetical protein VKA57_12955 [Solirubrobacteraceae bacterium]|nr:hypothetical protein [Solirubrobacteraceae bacterium]